jgi:hypothetical protein
MNPFHFIARFLRGTALLISLPLCGLAQAQTDHLGEFSKLPAHPRLLLTAGQEKLIQAKIENDKTAQKLHQALIAESDSLLTIAPVERIKIGKRLLDVSREALRRIFYLSYAYRITGQEKYLKRGEQEMLAIAAFSDWNPSHFLDTAEMTMGMAIGYDWMYDGLPPKSRDTIKAAIISKGVDTSIGEGKDGWSRETNNWNQVCNAGMSFGAIATFEDDPVKAKRVINRAINTVVRSMGEYGSDGAYPEGYMYWGYGTSFNVMLIAALDSAFATDFGLSAQPGFLQTANYLLHMAGPTGEPFNFSDSITFGEFHPAVFWFAQRQRDPSLIWFERNYLAQGDLKAERGIRLLPATMLWLGNQKMADVTPPSSLTYVGGDKTPVALMRTSWTDPNAIYVAMKGGSASNSHGHMDVGSFVMDANGVRWAMDFGMQNYESLESKNVDLWNMRQNSPRWDVFRLNNFAHNTLAVNGQLQRVEGMAKISDFSDAPQNMGATVDLSEIYKGQLKRAERRITIENQSQVRVRDALTAGDTAATVRWTMVTPATVKLLNAHQAELSKNGQTLIVQVDAPAEITLKTWSTDPVRDYDAPNPGTTLLGFEAKLAAGQAQDLIVRLIPNKPVVK